MRGSIRKPRVEILRDGTLHGKPVKVGDVMEVEPVVARRLIGRKCAKQALAPSVKPEEATKPTTNKKGKTE